MNENELLRATGAIPEGKTRGTVGEIRDRIIEAMTKPDGEAVDMDPGRMRAIAQGQCDPTSLDIALIADACKVPVWWLITGQIEEPSMAEMQETLQGFPLNGPPIVAITINTRKPDKWRFLDTETREVWRWDGRHFKRAGELRVDPTA